MGYVIICGGQSCSTVHCSGVGLGAKLGTTRPGDTGKNLGSMYNSVSVGLVFQRVGAEKVWIFYSFLPDA